jgi:uncharacterized protein
LSGHKDFNNLVHFPGETGNPLDLGLFGLNTLERIPAALFFLVLCAAAWLRFPADPPSAIFIGSVFLLDWALIRCLPLFKRSFGPAKPVVIQLAVARLVFSFLPFPWMAGIQGIGTLLVIYGFWIEPFNIRLTRQTLALITSTSSNARLRLLHLGDLHIERIGAREKALNRMIARLKPDLILFSGDFLNLSYRTDDDAIAAAREIIGQWQAPLGVFLVSGSPAVDYPEIVEKITSGLSQRWLRNEVVDLSINGESIHIIGLTCTHRPQIDVPQMQDLLAAKPGKKILLYHSPDLAPQAAEMGVDLMLSGHTHGGQVRLPFYGAMLTGSLYGKKYEAGRYLVEKMVLYVSRGLGMEGAGAPRVRFLCPPEIIL